MRIRVLPPAREEFLEAVAFYEREARGLGADFVEEFERALELVATSPHLGSYFEADIRRKLLRRFPFQIIYEVGSDELLVIAIAHLSRRPGYWQDR